MRIKRQYVLVKELLDVFGENCDHWVDATEISDESVLNFTGKEKNFSDEYLCNWMSTTNKKVEHIQRIRSIMQISPLLWKPIGLDVDWDFEIPLLDDGHHRLNYLSM